MAATEEHPSGKIASRKCCQQRFIAVEHHEVIPHGQVDFCKALGVIHEASFNPALDVLVLETIVEIGSKGESLIIVEFSLETKCWCPPHATNTHRSKLRNQWRISITVTFAMVAVAPTGKQGLVPFEAVEHGLHRILEPIAVMVQA